MLSAAVATPAGSRDSGVAILFIVSSRNGLGSRARCLISRALRTGWFASAVPIGVPSLFLRKARRMRILLVEDHEDTRRAMTTLWLLSAHDVTAVATAQEALAAVDGGGCFDCAVIDLGLPD